MRALALRGALAAGLAVLQPVITTPSDELTALSNDGSFRVWVRPVPARIPLNEIFSAEIEVRGVRQAFVPKAVAFDAVMPEHDHGMTTDAQVTPKGGGFFRVEGILLHMAGRWELHVDVTDDEGVIERAQMPVLVCQGTCAS